MSEKQKRSSATTELPVIVAPTAWEQAKREGRLAALKEVREMVAGQNVSSDTHRILLAVDSLIAKEEKG